MKLKVIRLLALSSLLLALSFVATGCASKGPTLPAPIPMELEQVKR